MSEFVLEVTRFRRLISRNFKVKSTFQILVLSPWSAAKKMDWAVHCTGFAMPLAADDPNPCCSKKGMIPVLIEGPPASGMTHQSESNSDPPTGCSACASKNLESGDQIG